MQALTRNTDDLGQANDDGGVSGVSSSSGASQRAVRRHVCILTTTTQSAR
jgi:hypothetical protein